MVSAYEVSAGTKITPKCMSFSVRFEVFTTMTVNNAVSWDATPYGSCKNHRFGGTYRLHHHGDNRRARSNVSSDYQPKHAAAADGGDMFTETSVAWHGMAWHASHEFLVFNPRLDRVQQPISLLALLNL
jgi:hypothetical protein